MEHPRICERYSHSSLSRSKLPKLPTFLSKLKFSRLQGQPRSARTREATQPSNQHLLWIQRSRNHSWDALRKMAYAVLRRNVPFYPDIGGGRNRLRPSDAQLSLKRPHISLTASLGVGFGFPALRAWVEIMNGVEQPPLPHNRVTLSDQKDILGNSIARLTWSISEAESVTYSSMSVPCPESTEGNPRRF